ncbi:hypothetical protein COLO4_12264 [Corchorus olitorius]|uniref:Uncharacterized protein n=1 Tax=Corchorus olitorius TaxID=93759 RepID=A0A1R3K1I7_9ROSI|nr:hypothetical protein COLO4_12264 [Corchorus olitorius]
MEEDKKAKGQEEEEEYVLLDLDAVSGQIDIPPGSKRSLHSSRFGGYDESNINHR